MIGGGSGVAASGARRRGGEAVGSSASSGSSSARKRRPRRAAAAGRACARRTLLGVARDLEAQRREPERRRSTPSTTRTAWMRRIGTTASERWNSPRRMRSRSPSRATEKPANETSEPIDDSAQAARGARRGELPAARRVGQQPRRVLDVALVRERVAQQLAPTRPARAGSRRAARRSAPRRASSRRPEPALGDGDAPRRPRGSSGRSARRRRANPLDLRRPDRLEHDLALLPAAGGTARAARRHRRGAAPGPPRCRAPGCGSSGTVVAFELRMPV